MRPLKIVGFVVGTLVALVVLAAVSIVLFVDPNDYRAEIEQRVQRITGRQLKIAGKLDLKLFPWLALEVNDLTLGNPPGYGPEPFLTVKSADVGVKLMPLLHKRIEVRRVKLQALNVTLVSRSPKDNNWKDLTQSGESEKSQGGPAAQIQIAGMDIDAATLLYRDETKEKRSLTRISNLDLHTGPLGGDEPVPVKSEFDYDDGTPGSALHLGIEAQLRMPKESSRVEIKDLLLKSKQLSARAPLLVLDTKAETLAPATLDLRYGDLPIKLTAAGERLFGDRIVTGKLTVDRVSPRKLMPSFGMKVPNTRDPNALTALAIKSDYRLTTKALQLHDLDLTLDDTRVRGRVAIDDLDSKALSFDLGVGTLNVDRYREPEAKSAAQDKRASPTNLPVEALRKLNVHGALRIAHAQLSDLKFDDVRLPVNAANGRIAVTPQARLFGGSYNGDITLDARFAKAKLALDEKARSIDIGSLVNAAFKTNRVTGRGDANAVLTGSGNTDAAILASLAGKIDANVKDGAFNGVDLWYELRRALALVKRTPLPTRTEPVRTQFKTFAGSATLADGVVRNDDLIVDMDYLKTRGKGTLNIATQAVDYRLVAEIYKLPTEGAGSEMADLKAVEIPIAVTGTLSAMKVRPDVSGLIKARLHKELDKQKGELKKKLGDKLKDLLGR